MCNLTNENTDNLNDDEIYYEWINMVDGCDFNDIDYLDDVVGSYLDDMKILFELSDKSNPHNLTDDEFIGEVEFYVVSTLQYLTIFLIKFEEYERYEYAARLHDIGVNTLAIIYLHNAMFDYDLDACRDYAREQIKIAIDIIKDNNIIQLMIDTKNGKRNEY